MMSELMIRKHWLDDAVSVRRERSLSQRRFSDGKSLMECPGTECGSSLWQVGDQPPEHWHGLEVQ